jgi:Tol biopolymer transport system component
MIDGSTGELRQLSESGQAFYPRWSYDGKYLAFIRITDAKFSSGTLWVVRRDGKEAYQVQGLPQSIEAGDFQWSPTDHLLAVGSWDITDGIWLVPVNEKPKQFKIYSPMWSKDGNNLFYVQDGALWVISIGGGKPQQVLGGMTEEDTWGFYGHIRFSDWFDWFK